MDSIKSMNTQDNEQENYKFTILVDDWLSNINKQAAIMDQRPSYIFCDLQQIMIRKW